MVRTTSLITLILLFSIVFIGLNYDVSVSADSPGITSNLDEVEVGILHREDDLESSIKLEPVYNNTDLEIKLNGTAIPVSNGADGVNIEKKSNRLLINGETIDEFNQGSSISITYPMKIGPISSKQISELESKVESQEEITNITTIQESGAKYLEMELTELDAINSIMKIINDRLSKKGYSYQGDYLVILEKSQDKQMIEQRKDEFNDLDSLHTISFGDKWALLTEIDQLTTAFSLINKYDINMDDFKIYGPGFYRNKDNTEVITIDRPGKISILLTGDYSETELMKLKELISDKTFLETNLVKEGSKGLLIGSFNETVDESLIKNYLTDHKGIASKIGGKYRTEFATVSLKDFTEGNDTYQKSSSQKDSSQIEEIIIHGNGNPIELENNNRSYRGKMKLRLKDNGFMVTNVVGLEDYLKSVVPSETYSSWDIEALKAQAVASRTYAIYSQQNNNYNDFDLTDCQNSQVYKGYQAENSKTTEAVNSTMGEAIYYNGDVINALYHSNSGGKTEDPENVWGSAIPYLSSVESSWDEEAEDSNSDIYNWEKQISREKISEKLNEDYDLGELKDIEILERTSAGRVKELIYRGTKGEEKIFGDKNRTPMGLKSTKFEKTSNREDTEVSIKTGTGRQKKYVERDQLYAVSADSSIPKEVTESQQEYYIKSGNGIREVRKILQFTFSGKGFGHGLGMSQWGAHGMALEGYNYREILNHYYSDQIIIE